MNKDRRAKIAKIINEIEAAKEILQSVLSDEQDSFDNMPENLQSSIRAEESEEAIDSMENAIEMLESAVEELGNIN